MHEMGVVMQATREIIAFAEDNGIDKIAEVVFEIGEGSGIVNDYFKKVWPVACNGTMLEGCDVIIEVIPGMAQCMDCNEIYNVVANKGCCPECGSRMKEVLSGLDCTIKEIHVPEEDIPEHLAE